MPAHCCPDPDLTYIDALSLWGQLCVLETMLNALHMEFEDGVVAHCKQICIRMMEQTG